MVLCELSSKGPLDVQWDVYLDDFCSPLMLFAFFMRVRCICSLELRLGSLSFMSAQPK